MTVSDTRIERLSKASTRRHVEPDDHFAWGTLRAGQVVADELLTVHGLGLDLSAAQRATLSREELASMLLTGIRFEAVLTAGFAMQIAGERNLLDARTTYMLHEMGEETRHSRAFLRLVGELGPTADNPLERGLAGRLRRRLSRSLLDQPALLCVFILAGEEIPDLMQKIAAEHPETDPLVADVNRYHRLEEARHLAFARTVLPELSAKAGRVERWRIRRVAPAAIDQLFRTLVHPGVYRSVGLPALRTWRAANRTPLRVALRHAGTRPIVEALLDAGVLKCGRIPRGWRRLAGVDQQGAPLATAPAGPA